MTRAFGLAFATVATLQAAAYANDSTNTSRRARTPQTGGSPPIVIRTEPRKRTLARKEQTHGSQGLPQKMRRPAPSGANGNSDIGYTNTIVIGAQDGTVSTTSVSTTTKATLFSYRFRVVE